ncbi:MAG: transglycosylase domain-containing protein [Chitinispirillia bacterium]|nr:transglycosylase domain-containing protein [Chitinispirillia bacterium]MCL2242771.1 transglycosylase domain-containing protein [Chitinispirillia bacterium]
MKFPKIPKFLKIMLIIALMGLLSLIPGYYLARYAFNKHFSGWGDRLVDLERRGLLSTEYGAGWQDVLMVKAMELEAQRITTEADGEAAEDGGKVVDGVAVADYPSLAVVKLLNEVREYSNTILVADRNNRAIIRIKTDHRRAQMNEFPHTLVTALIAAEDRYFRDDKLGFRFESFARAFALAIPPTVRNMKPASPRGTSTITQQVAKLFLSRLDEIGQRQVSNSLGRKTREMRLASALRKTYTSDEILEVYMNHAVTSDHGLIGYKDIARGLFNKPLDSLSDAECVYLARMVKWGRNIKPKIAAQCRIDMARMGDALGWSAAKRAEVLAGVDSLTFERPKRIEGGHGPLVDLANEYWLLTLHRNGSSAAQTAQMDLIDPNSLVRRKGNLTIKLTIDLPLQRELERLVAERGYGGDTTIMSEVRIGSHGEDVTMARTPGDTLRHAVVLSGETHFAEPGKSFITTLSAGDTVFENIRYARISGNKYRRSVFYYVRRPTLVDGQYFAYSIMCSKTGQLLAYHSKDRLGSKLNCLLRNRTPTGSSLVKPVMNALNYDLEIFKPYSKWSDEAPVPSDVPWARSIFEDKGRAVGVMFLNTSVRGRGYQVNNFGRKFEGCKYVFEHLTSSNNVLGVETVYRLNRTLYIDGDPAPGAFPLLNFFYRVGAQGRVRDDLRLTSATGVRVFKELGRVAGIPVDSMMQGSRRVAVSDSMYSVALGAFEMSLYEQMHMFNILYNNDLIEQPGERNSLAIQSIELNGRPVALNDTLRRYHPFVDKNNIRPTLLGLHNRLATRAEGLADYDIDYTPDLTDPAYSDPRFDQDAFYIDDPLSNFAKSGTSDDIIRPFNVDASSDKRTNYCMWNAVLRIDMAKLPGSSGRGGEVRDITVASVGEGNLQYTGPRDGKSLHKFLTTGLLRVAGVKSPKGFFTQYEEYLRRVTPPSENCGAWVEPENVEDGTLEDLLRGSTRGEGAQVPAQHGAADVPAEDEIF